MADQRDHIPEWLCSSEDYRPSSRREAFVTKNLLQLSSLLGRFRLDGGRDTHFSPSAPCKLLLAGACILLTSLTRNYLFVLVMLALVLVRACLLPKDALARLAPAAALAGGFTALVMLPAALMGQGSSVLWLATKAVVSTSIVLTVALTTPTAQMTGALRAIRVSPTIMLAVDLALNGIVRLGETAREVLTALALRSVGHNRSKTASMGGVGGVVLLKASRAAQDSYDAMRCRCFDGSYQTGEASRPRAIDALWLALLACLVALFLYLQKVV